MQCKDITQQAAVGPDLIDDSVPGFEGQQLKVVLQVVPSIQGLSVSLTCCLGFTLC